MKMKHTFRELDDAVLERAVTAALERVPQVSVPAGFAARVAAEAAATPLKAPARRTQYGLKIAVAASVLLAAALFVLAPHASPSLSSIAFLAEMTLLVELCALAYGLMRLQREEF